MHGRYNKESNAITSRMDKGKIRVLTGQTKGERTRAKGMRELLGGTIRGLERIGRGMRGLYEMPTQHN